MRRLPPRSTRPYTLFPYTTLFRSIRMAVRSSTVRASSHSRRSTTAPKSTTASARARRRRCSAISSRRGADEKCHAKIQRGHSSVRPELVEGPFFLSALKREERCLDKLSTKGKEKCPLCALAREVSLVPVKPPASAIGKPSCRERRCHDV